MLTINYLFVVFLIGASFILETKQQSVISTVHECTNTMCDNSYTIDLLTCLCIDNEPVNDSNSVRNRRLVSKLIRDDEIVMQASNDRCRNDEQWNGNECISLISFCPGGYRWNGHTCIIQVLTETAALIATGPDTKCALNAKHKNRQSGNSETQSLPEIVMPTYSTSPQCTFGFIWSNDKCMRNPPTCPSQYVFHENLCHLTTSSTSPSSTPSQIVATTMQSTFNDRLNKNRWASNLQHEIENSSAEVNTDNDQTENKHCCTIMSPRMCRRRVYNRNVQWQCYHHQYRRCGDFCTKPKLYMRPKKSIFVEPLLIMPPPPRRLQKLMLNLVHRETNIGKNLNNCHSTVDFIYLSFPLLCTLCNNYQLCCYF